MQYRTLGRTTWDISAISFGAWAIGGDAWGQTDDSASKAALHAALDGGVNFIDTADVYGDGHSERLIGQTLRERGTGERVYVATKAGRRLDPHLASGYTRENLTRFVERSLKNLGVEALDLLQLHCPPHEVYWLPEVFDALDGLAQAGKLRYYGVSVERVDEAMQAITFPNVQSVQIIFNMFRLKPADAFFAAARARQVGILARVPLASGLLSGRLSATTQFAPTDHRSYNREGAAFDKGETFSGVPYDVGLAAVERLRPLVPQGTTMPEFALRWILMFPEVTAAIPGGKTPEQVRDNMRAADQPPLDAETMRQVQAVYDDLIREHVHQQW